jgi:hypothetical protein
MVKFTTTLLQFGEQGDKTGWTYIVIPADVSEQIKPGFRKSIRVKGKLDNFPIKDVSMMPRKGGGFILAINAAMRKGTGKRKGAMLTVQLQEDRSERKLSEELMECLADEPKALAFFNTLAPSHQRYFSKWIEDAKTEATKTKRITLAVNSLARKLDYGAMIRSTREE